MAYDPKNYLAQALKTGFKPVYSQPASVETGEAPRYEGDEARFGDVVVRPLQEFVGQTEQDQGTPQQAGYAVSSPLSGKYQGYFRNDIFDNEGNFLRTTISEPGDTGLRDLAQLGLTAASMGAFGPMGGYLSKGIGALGALKSGDPLRILAAASNIPGVSGAIPTELKDLMGYLSKAGQLKSALSGDPSAILGLAKGVIPGGVDLTGETFEEGFFDYGGPGYLSETGELPESEVARETESLLKRYPAADPASDLFVGEGVLSGVPEWDDAAIAAGLPLGNLEQDFSVAQTKDGSKVVDSSGNVGTFVDGEFVVDTGVTPISGLGSTTQTADKTKKADEPKKETKSGLDIAKLMALMAAMQPQQQQEKDDYRTAQLSDLDRELMYGLRG